MAFAPATRTSELGPAYREARRRTTALFQVPTLAAYLTAPIALRHPIVFYDGHLDAFIWNTLFRQVLGAPPLDPELDALFERGIDPADATEARERRIARWPERKRIQAYKASVQAYLADVLEDPHPTPHVRWALSLVLEHELMHQETFAYLLHRLPPRHLQRVPGVVAADGGPALDVAPPPHRRVAVPAGRVRLGDAWGQHAFTWDNERPEAQREVPAFEIDVHPVTCSAFRTFIEAGGYGQPELWSAEGRAWLERTGAAAPFGWRRERGGWRLRAFFGDRPLPAAWPVQVTALEAEAYARWAGGALPTEAEWQRAAYGDDARAYPWGDAAPTPDRGHFGFAAWDPAPVGTHASGASPWGVEDLLGNGWEWTCTPFAPFDGFQAEPLYPGYSADFFDGHHRVVKGGSVWTDVRLLRRSFRNWYYGDYPYAATTFRVVYR